MSKPTIHCLKVTPEFFPAIACGDKNFEVRVNDRNFKTGDMLVLQEWDNGLPVPNFVPFQSDRGAE